MRHALHFERVIAASRHVVCRAWTEPDRLKVWYKPDDAWATPTAELDLRVGGAYRIGLQPPGGATFYEVGWFRDVSLPDRLVYTLRFEGVHLHEPTGAEMEKYETVITAEFEELPDERTRVIVTHAGYRTTEDRDRHRNGWPRFLDHLASHCIAAAG
jgi:uncharacterized protein YndB with AHSA1/START domain